MNNGQHLQDDNNTSKVSGFWIGEYKVLFNGSIYISFIQLSTTSSQEVYLKELFDFKKKSILYSVTFRTLKV